MPFFLYVLAAHSEVQINEGLDWARGDEGGGGEWVTKNLLSLKS